MYGLGWLRRWLLPDDQQCKELCESFCSFPTRRIVISSFLQNRVQNFSAHISSFIFKIILVPKAHYRLEGDGRMRTRTPVVLTILSALCKPWVNGKIFLLKIINQRASFIRLLQASEQGRIEHVQLHPKNTQPSAVLCRRFPFSLSVTIQWPW